MHVDNSRAGAAPVILRAVFFLIAALVAAAAGYAGWIVVRYWDQVGV